MVDAADIAQKFISGRNRQEIDSDSMLLFALVRAIEIIGEAATRVTEESRRATPEVPWPMIVSMRNRLVHALGSE